MVLIAMEWGGRLVFGCAWPIWDMFGRCCSMYAFHDVYTASCMYAEEGTPLHRANWKVFLWHPGYMHGSRHPSARATRTSFGDVFFIVSRSLRLFAYLEVGFGVRSSRLTVDLHLLIWFR